MAMPVNKTVAQVEAAAAARSLVAGVDQAL